MQSALLRRFFLKKFAAHKFIFPFFTTQQHFFPSQFEPELFPFIRFVREQPQERRRSMHGQ